MSDLLRALRLADPALGRFDPLPRVLALDDFDRGFCGWSQLVGNYEDDVDTMLPGYAQHLSPMLSTLAHWDAGSHGGVDGDHALKLATRPRRGARNAALKRLTFREAGPIRVELIFAFKPEASELRLSETDVGAVGLVLDLQGGDHEEGAERVMPHLRFLNAEGGRHVQRWQFKRRAEPVVPIGGQGATISHDHLGPNGWEDLPGGDQRLCYNEIATKVNWHYLRLDFDLRSMTAMGLRCNDRDLDLAGFDSLRLPAMKNLWCMMNVVVFVDAAADKRAFLYLDGACVSADVP